MLVNFEAYGSCRRPCTFLNNRFRIFSLFPKGYWARCFGNAFSFIRGVWEGVWGRPGGVWKMSWGGPGVVRGASGGVLGGSWALLERSWNDLSRSPISDRFLIDLGRQKGANRDAFGEAKGSQNRSQNDPQTTQNRRRFSRAKKTLFKTVSEPSCADLGPS